MEQRFELRSAPSIPPMNTYRLPIIVLVGSIVMLFGASAAERPNLIIIMTDDHGYADVGFNGCEDIPTPNIDRIATEGADHQPGSG